MLQQDPYLIDGHKAHYHMERILQSKSDPLNTFPIYVEISPVGNCNHRCTFCAVDYIGYQMRKIETPILQLALDSMAQNGVKSVMFAGEGEPMLHPDIAKITEHAGQIGLDVAFTTNGTALTEKFINRALQHTKWIKVSMNGGEKSYAKVHQTKQEDYEKVWKNISNACISRDASNGETVVGIQCVVLPENMEDLQQLCERAKSVGCQYIVLKPYSQHKSSITKKYENLTYENQRDLFQKLQKLSTENFKVIARTTAMDDWDSQDHSYTKCLSTPYFWAYIMADGGVYGCSAYLLNDKFNYGNINNLSFKEIWLGAKRQESIEEMKTLDISKCRLNCRMHQVNKFLWDVDQGNPHKNFI